MTWATLLILLFAFGLVWPLSLACGWVHDCLRVRRDPVLAALRAKVDR